jgi:anti-sigma factor RsiW
MSCGRFDELLPLYLEGELADEEKAGVDAHLAQCPVCTESLAVYSRLEASLVERHLARPPAALLAAHVIERLAPSRKWSALKTLLSLPSLISAGFIAAGILLFLGKFAVPESFTSFGSRLPAYLEAFARQLGRGAEEFAAVGEVTMLSIYIGVFGLILLSGSWMVMRFVRQ